MTQTDSEGEVKHETNFLGNYCEYCDTCVETYCWHFSSDWEEGLNVDNPSSKPTIEILPFPTVRKPPVGWSEIRCAVTKGTDQAKPPSLTRQVSTNSGTSMQ